MTLKGKYAARAANREAARDNEIIAEKVEQIRNTLSWGDSSTASVEVGHPDVNVGWFLR